MSIYKVLGIERSYKTENNCFLSCIKTKNNSKVYFITLTRSTEIFFGQYISFYEADSDR